MKIRLVALASACIAGAAPSLLLSQAPAKPSPAAAAPNDGTDPTRPPRSATIRNEFLSARGSVWINTVRAQYQTPVSKDARSNLRVTVPFATVGVPGATRSGLGDIGVAFTRVMKVTPRYGVVLTGEGIFNTAGDARLGTGQNVVKGSAVYAKFLKRGIIAPSLVQSTSVWGDAGRASVNLTTFDLYYVPKLSIPGAFITVDPSLNRDWVNDRTFPALSVQVGKLIGPMMGGTSQVSIKPSVFFGGDRTTNWGIEAFFRVVGF